MTKAVTCRRSPRRSRPSASHCGYQIFVCFVFFAAKGFRVVCGQNGVRRRIPSFSPVEAEKVKYGVRRHDGAFLHRDMSPQSKTVCSIKKNARDAVLADWTGEQPLAEVVLVGQGTISKVEGRGQTSEVRIQRHKDSIHKLKEAFGKAEIEIPKPKTRS